MRIERCTTQWLAAWHAMRAKLWPNEELEKPGELASLLTRPECLVVVALDERPELVAFAEATIRHDYVNGCDTSPVVFLEGIYVDPGHRRRGAASALVEAVADWGRASACHESASDALLDNRESHAMHAALGFEETERVVYFRKLLT